MNINRIRCHAAVSARGVTLNAVVTADASGRVGLSVSPFDGETHSTEDFDGIILIHGNDCMPDQATVAALVDKSRFSESLKAVAAMLTDGDVITRVRI